ncbi:MAG: putative sugar nucleotidyl transferase, partial [Gemmatimonadaceae bacterium]
MTELVLYDDAIARAFEPFALTRPFGEMRAGIALGRERWEGAMRGAAAGALVAEHLRDFDEPGAARAVREARAGAIVANTRCLVPLGWIAPDADVWTCDGRIAAVRLSALLQEEALKDGAAPL